jgi:tripartite ATP-independent transporter DctP family solute receptor
MKWLTFAVGVGAMLFSVATEARDLKAGHILNAQSDQGQAIEWFAARVNELTKGQLNIKVFHSGELGKSMPVMVESVATGSQDFLIDTTDYFKTWDDRFGIMNTPYVFRDRQHFKHFLASPLYADMIKSVESHGVVIIGKKNYNWIRAGDRGLITRKPIMVLDDLKGMKLRMFQAEAPIKAWAALGANIQVIPWPDVYTALATGAVDGLTGVLSTSYLTKHTEVVKYFTNVREYYQVVTTMISKRTWDRLTPEQQRILEQAVVEAGEQYVKISEAETRQYDMNAINDDGVTVIIPPIGPWINKMKPVFAEFEDAKIIPKGLIGEIQTIP